MGLFFLEKACHYLKIFAAHRDQLHHKSLTGSIKIYVMARTTEYTGLGISILLSILTSRLCAVENWRRKLFRILLFIKKEVHSSESTELKLREN